MTRCLAPLRRAARVHAQAASQNRSAVQSARVGDAVARGAHARAHAGRERTCFHTARTRKTGPYVSAHAVKMRWLCGCRMDASDPRSSEASFGPGRCRSIAQVRRDLHAGPCRLGAPLPPCAGSWLLLVAPTATVGMCSLKLAWPLAHL